MDADPEGKSSCSYGRFFLHKGVPGLDLWFIKITNNKDKDE